MFGILWHKLLPNLYFKYTVTDGLLKPFVTSLSLRRPRFGSRSVSRICVWLSGNDAGFPNTPSVFLCPYYSTSAPILNISFTHLPQTLYGKYSGVGIVEAGGLTEELSRHDSSFSSLILSLNIKGKLCSYTHQGGEKVHLRSFLILSLNRVYNQLHAPASLNPKKGLHGERMCLRTGLDALE